MVFLRLLISESKICVARCNSIYLITDQGVTPSIYQILS